MASKPADATPGALDVLIRKANAEESQRHWRAILAPYEGADNQRSLLQLSVTLLLYGVTWAVLLWSVHVS